MQTFPSLTQGHRLQPAAGSSAARSSHRRLDRSIKCASQRREAGPGPQSARAAADCVEEKYPSEGLELDPEDGLFPRRQPGSFPNIAVKRTLGQRLQSAISTFAGAPAAGAPAASVSLSVDAPAASSDTAAEEYDPLRDGPARYLGYANECGEAFAAWIPAWGVPFSYGVAISYVLVDTYDKWQRAFNQAQSELGSVNIDPKVEKAKLTQLLAAERALDTVVWQMLASVILPGYTIHTIVAAVHGALLPLEATEQLQATFQQLAPTVGSTPAELLALFDKTLPTMIGLAVIPFIVHPLDESVHALLNRTLRPAMKKMVCSQGGSLAGLALCADCESEEQCNIEE